MCVYILNTRSVEVLLAVFEYRSMAVFTIFMCCLFLNLVFCEVVKQIEMEDNCSIEEFPSFQVISSINTSVISQKDQFHNSNFSYSCSSNGNTNLCVFSDDGLSKCGDIPYDILQCSSQGNISVLDCYCITYNENDKESQAEIGKCIYNCFNVNKTDFSDSVYHMLPKNTLDSNKVVCQKEFSRNGTLCGKCKDGYYPLAYSFNLTCVKCPHGRANWWKFVLSAFLPLTFFYFIVLFFKINATSSHLHGFIYYSQIISMPALARTTTMGLRHRPNYSKLVKCIGSLYGIWNLDFFRAFDLGICLGTDTLQTLSFDIAVGIYPLLLMVLSYVLIDLYDRNFRILVILWKPFLTFFSLFRRNWEIRTSLIDAYATFFFLSNVKFLSASFDLLVPVRVFQLSSSKGFHHSWRLFYDATIPYFGETHLPYAILAIVTLLVFVLSPMVLLLLYPFQWFQKLLNIFPFHWYILHTFMDSFYGCYKNGTEPGTRDCRWFASLFYIVRLLVFLIGAFTLNAMYYIIDSMCLVLFAVLLLIVRPYKNDLSNYTDINVIFILLLASWYVTVTGIDIASVKNHDLLWIFYLLTVTFGILPLLYISVIVLYWIFKHRKFGFELIKRMHAFRQGYDWWTLK